jgi:hypothetical protein
VAGWFVSRKFPTSKARKFPCRAPSNSSFSLRMMYVLYLK